MADAAKPGAKSDAAKDPAFLELLQQYKALNEAAKAGRPVHAEDFDRLEAAYDQNPAVQKKFAEALAQTPEAKAYLQDHPGQKFNPFDYAQMMQAFLSEDRQNARDPAHGTAMMAQEKAQKIEAITKQVQFFQAHPDLLPAVANTRALDQDFLKEHPIVPKHTDIDASVTSQDDLMRQLLRKNPGLAFADMHTKSATSDFISSRMALFKSEGVDTIYTEAPFAESKALQDMSAQQLRDLAKQIDSSPEARQHIATLYNQPVDKIDNLASTQLTMMAAAKEQGIRMVYVDEENGPARESEFPFLATWHRVDQDNFVWTEHILADRKAQAQATGQQGKFLIFGGKLHFTDMDMPSMKLAGLDLPSHENRGLVADALGTPVIAFEQSDPGSAPAFRKTSASSTSSVDFYLPGGTNYVMSRSPQKAPAASPEEQNAAPDRTGKIDWKTLGIVGGIIAAAVALIALFFKKSPSEQASSASPLGADATADMDISAPSVPFNKAISQQR